MPLDGVSAHFLAIELNSALHDARIEKIYQPDRYEVCFHIRTARGHVRLLMSCNPSFPRIHLTDHLRDNPKLPPSFCMLLRKHVSGGRVVKVTSPPYERIIELHLSSLNELQDITQYRLIIEMMGRYSNIILLNSDSIIIDSALHIDSRTSRVREIMPARKYDYPPNQGKILPSDAISMIQNGDLPVLEEAKSRPIEKAFLESLKGFSPKLALELCLRTPVDPRKGYRQLDKKEVRLLLDAALPILLEIQNGPSSPTLYRATKDAAPIDFHALRLQSFGIPISVSSLSEAIDRLHEKSMRDHSFEQSQKPLISFVQNALSHAIRKKQQHESDINDSKDYMLYKKYGDLILVDQGNIGDESTEWIAEDFEQPGVFHRIPLNPSLRPSANAQIYFRKYRKLKTRTESAASFIKEDDSVISYLLSLLQVVKSASDDADINAIHHEISEMNLSSRSSDNPKAPSSESASPGKSKTGKQRSRAMRSAASRAAEKTERIRTGKKKRSRNDTDLFRKFDNSDGTLILCGRNNIQNDALTFRTAASDDLWFHAKNRPGSHVVLRCFGNNPENSSIESAARVAAYYSSAMTDSRGDAGQNNVSLSSSFTVEVDYCAVKRVKKIPGAKPGMVTYDQHKTLLVHPGLPGNPA